MQWEWMPPTPLWGVDLRRMPRPVADSPPGCGKEPSVCLLPGQRVAYLSSPPSDCQRPASRIVNQAIAVASPRLRGQDLGCEGPWVEVAVWSTRLRTRSEP